MPWDPFAALNLPRRFDLAAADVERAYLERAAAVHPDMGEDDAAGSADLNRARQDLKDAETRANVLLALMGGPGKEADRSLPNGFLMEMMEVREQMEADGAVGREKWEKWAEDRRGEHERLVAELFRKVESGAEGATLKQIRTHLNAWRYIERMLEQSGGAGGAGGF